MKVVITLNRHWISNITVRFDLEEGFSSRLGLSTSYICNRWTVWFSLINPVTSSTPQKLFEADFHRLWYIRRLETRLLMCLGRVKLELMLEGMNSSSLGESPVIVGPAIRALTRPKQTIVPFVPRRLLWESKEGGWVYTGGTGIWWFGRGIIWQ